MSERNEGRAYADGYRAAVDDCLKLLMKWFFNKREAKACGDEILKLRRDYE
jgi:hypothetical protein